MDKDLKEHFNTKHPRSLKNKVYQYFKTHTARETARKFGLTHGQVIGILEMGRRNGHISRRFKDKRNKTPWTFEQDLKMIQCCGLIDRVSVAKRIGRPSVSEKRNGFGLIKERIYHKYNARTKYLHGAPYGWVKAFFGDYFRDRAIRTKAGPTKQFKLLIIPWVDIVHIAESIDHPQKDAFYALAKFQRFVFKCENDWQVRKKIKEIIYEDR